jgi:methylmalonyl-CoA mutase cobalamin-binding domain/chain
MRSQEQRDVGWTSALRDHIPKLAEAIVARQYAEQPIWERYGEKGRELSLRDQRWHLGYLADALEGDDPVLFVNYIKWCKVLFANLRLPDGALEGALSCTREVLAAQLPDALRAPCLEILDSAIAEVEHAPCVIESFLRDEAPLGQLAQHYLEHLLAGRRREASALILDAVGSGTSVKDVYLHVFQPCQQEVGRLWQHNQLSVAQEHYCTAATQLVMSQLYPHIFSVGKNGRRLVAACVGGELHEIGVRMVADFFELEGWDTYYLGANAPGEAIIEAVKDRQADVLGLSVTMSFHLARVQRLIDDLRSTDHGAQVKVLVGGYPFISASKLWRTIGADGWAPNAQGAVERATELLGVAA